MAGNIFILDLSFVQQKSREGERQVLFRYVEFVIIPTHRGGELWSHWKYGPKELTSMLKQSKGKNQNENGSFPIFPGILGKKAHIRFPKRDLLYIEFY